MKFLTPTKLFRNALIMALMISVLLSCGGGTTSTGGSGPLVTGKLIDTSGAALPNIEVSLLIEGALADAAFTDALGEFVVAAEAPISSATLQFSGGETNASVEVGNISPNASTVQLVIKQIEPEHVEVVERTDSIASVDPSPPPTPTAAGTLPTPPAATPTPTSPPNPPATPIPQTKFQGEIVPSSQDLIQNAQVSINGSALKAVDPTTGKFKFSLPGAFDQVELSIIINSTRSVSIQLPPFGGHSGKAIMRVQVTDNSGELSTLLGAFKFIPN